MNVLLGFLSPTSGSCALFGEDTRRPIARQRIGFLPELTYYYKYLNAEELLRFYARIFRLPAREIPTRIDTVLRLVDLEAARRRPIRTYSKGMQQRVGFGASLDQPAGSFNSGRADQRIGSHWAHEGSRDYSTP